MLQKTPPLAATEAFLAAAHAQSFRAAAASLALSPSAFSRRIQLLEGFLRAQLFDRSGSTAELTAVGRRYLAAIEPAVDAIRQASANIRLPLPDSWRVAVSHSLAVEWLMPRLAKAAQDLAIHVELVITRDRQALRDDQVDFALWGGTETGGGDSDIIVPLDAVPVTSVRLADGRMPPATIDELATHRILGVRHPPDIWQQWLHSVGFTGPTPAIAAYYDTNQLSYEAAACGLGVTLAVPLLANRYLEDGRLRACAVAPAPTGMAYWLHHARPAARRHKDTRRFVDWLKAEAQESKQRFQSLAMRGAGGLPVCATAG